MDKITVGDIMTENPIKVKVGFDVGSVTHLLLRYRINGLLVVDDNDDDKLIGIITTTDLLRIMGETLEKGAHKIDELRKISKTSVGQLATRDVKSLQKDDSVLKAIALMHQKSIHTIPIYDKDKLVGVVGRHDILNMAFA